MQLFETIFELREGGRADVPDTYLAHWSRGSVAFAKLEGLLLHPVSFRKFRGDAAELLFSPGGKGYPAAILASRALARAANQRQFGPDIVPFQRTWHIQIVRQGHYFDKAIVGIDDALSLLDSCDYVAIEEILTLLRAFRERTGNTNKEGPRVSRLFPIS